MSSKQSDVNPFDPMGLMKSFDPMKFLDEFNQALSCFSMPGFNAGDLLENQRKNLEALTVVNRSLMEGSQKLLQRQIELLTQTNREAATAAKTLAGAKPGELQQKQAELIGGAYDKAIAALQETTELVNKAQQEALQILDQRWNEGIEELQSLAGKPKG